jgi:hypothetical protein
MLPLLLQQLQVSRAEAVQAVDEQLLRCCCHQGLLVVHQQQAHVAQQREVAAEVLIVLICDLQSTKIEDSMQQQTAKVSRGGARWLLKSSSCSYATCSDKHNKQE